MASPGMDSGRAQNRRRVALIGTVAVEILREFADAEVARPLTPIAAVGIAETEELASSNRIAAKLL